jgi:hypothetical protein
MDSTTEQPKAKAVNKKLVLEQLWRKGILTWLLDDTQKQLQTVLYEGSHKINTWLLPRRFGKTRTLCVLALETCLKKPRSIVKFLSPTKLQVERNVRPLFKELLDSCPPDIVPEFRTKDQVYYFPNGSEIQLAGSEGGNIDSIRGGSSQICIVDEAQDVTDLRYAVNSVLVPTTLTTKGKVIIAGTPPKDPDHEFLQYVEEADFKDILIKRTIYDNPRLSADDIKQQIEAMGGEHTEDFQREFLCKIFKSKTNTVVPEFDEDREKECVFDVAEMPPFYDAFVGMDIGYKDWTVVLFGYFDFLADRLVIQDEIIVKTNQLRLEKLAKDIEAVEKRLWVAPLTNEVIKPRKRVSDHDLITINEVKKHSNYYLHFDLADKRDKSAGINFIRMLIGANRIVISPKCKILIKHLKNAKWKSSIKDDFARCPEGSHYDAVPALVYLARAVDFKRNPYPRDFFPKANVDMFINRVPQKVEHESVYKKIMNLKPKGKMIR